MNFDEKIEFIIGQIEKFDDPFDPPTATTIHEKTVQKAKRVTEETGAHPPIILTHAVYGIIPSIIEFPYHEADKVRYCQEIKKLLIAFEATGYTMVLSGWTVNYNEHAQSELFSETRPSLHPNKQEVLQILTENDYNFRRTSTYKIIKRTIKGEEKVKLIQREDFEEFEGRLSGLLERKTQH